MNTPRKYLWPKRWLRSFAGAALATGLVGGTVWGQPDTPPAKPMDSVKADAPKADPKTPAPAPKPKQITFAMSDKPWSAVIEWYANETQLAFNSVEKPPTGTFNFIPPKDPKTGQPKQYTLSEVTNVINESLLTKNFVLVRGETTFRLWPASEKIDPALVRRVDVAELKTLASKDAVQVVLPLQHLNAADQVLDVQKMMSKIGEVVPLQGRNGLIMIDYAGNLQRIVEDLTSTEAGDTAADTYSHPCVYIKARDAATQVRDFLGVAQPDQGDSSRRDRGFGRDGFGRDGFGRDGFDPRQFMPPGGGAPGFDPRMFDPGRGGPDGGRRGFGRNVKPTYVVADDATNTVHINAPADQVARAKGLLTKIDVGTKKVTPGHPEWKTYTVPDGTADGIAQALQVQYRLTTIGIRALGGNQIVVYATPADQLDIIEYINDFGKANKEATETIPVTMDVAEAVLMLKGMFAAQDKGGPYIGAHPNGTGVVVRGKPSQVTAVKEALSKSGATSDSDVTSPSGNVRIINLKDGSAADLAEAIRMMMEGMGKNPVKVIRPDGSPIPLKPATRPGPINPREVPKGESPGEKKEGVEPGALKKIGYGVRDLDTKDMVAMGGGQLYDPAAPKPKPTGSPVTITAVGDRLIITGDDPKAVALAYELAQLVKKPGEVYKVFPLKNGNAVEVARVLNEWFNGPQQQQQGQGRNPFANFSPFSFGRGGSPFGGSTAMGAEDATKPRVRIVAEQSSNSLLVRANALDLITIQNLLDTVLDSAGSTGLMKPFFIGPLQYAVATEVVTILKDVYRESTNQAASQFPGGGAFAGGFGSPFGFGFAGGRNQQPLDSLGRPKQVMLTISADDRTNSIVGIATEQMAKDIGKVVEELELRAKDSTKVVQLVPTGSIDPLLVQEVIDAIQGRAPAGQTQMPPGRFGGMGTSPFGNGGGMSPFGTGGYGPFGTGGFGSGRGGFGGGGRGGFGGGFGTPGGGRFGSGFGGGGRGGFGGPGRGGGSRSQRAPDPSPPGGLWRGPDFFEQRDMEVPQQTLLYDPYEEMMSLRRAAGSAPAVDAVQVLDPVKLASGESPRLPANVLAQAKELVQADPKAQPKKSQFDLIIPRGPVTATPLEEFNAVIITANNQADLELVRQILRQLEQFLRDEGARVGPKMELVPLKHADAVELTGLVNQLGARAAGQPAQPRPATPAPGPFGGGFPFGGALAQQQQQAAGAGGSVLLLPLPRQNAILMFGSDLRFPYYRKLIEDLDKPNANPLVPVKLEKASAQQVATQLSQLYSQRYPGSAGTLIRFTYDTSSNSVLVQAGPADLEEIKTLIQYLDTSTSGALNELRIIRLRNTSADDVSNTLQSALFQNILPPAIGVAAPTAAPAAPAAPFGAFPFAAAFPPAAAPAPGAQVPGAAVRPATIGSAATNTTKTVTLRFFVPGPKGGTFESGYLEDVHITADIRSNSLLVSAPRQTQELLAAVISQLDTPSAAQARVNIFTLKRADAVLTANLLQQLFGGAARQQPTQPAGGGPLGGGPLGGGPLGGGPLGGGPLGGTTTAASAAARPLLTTTGQPGEGAGLIPLQVAVDDRTNSIIVAASLNDLDAIRAIIARLEAADVQDRATHVIKLRNAGAVDVATALRDVMTQSLTIIQTGLIQTNYLELQRNVVVVPEPVTNNLLINATPQAMQALIPVIERLDAQPLQVAIETLIAEVILTNNEEFGIEVGLQSPVLFSRSVIPSSSASFANATGGFIPPGVTVNSTIAQYAETAFPFNNVTLAPQYNNAISPSLVGFQGLTNYGVGRANATGIGGFVFSAASDTVNVLIRALKTQGRVDNLTRPTVTVLDNQLGIVNVGGLYPYVTGGQFTALGTFQPNIAQQQIGTTLEVTPRISPDGRVLMRVAPSIIAPRPTLIDLGNGSFATAFDQTTVQTTVSVMDGETIVLGGLITKKDDRQENKIPWLGDLPYCGALFRYRTQIQERRELLVILTPHIIRNCADSERLLIEEARKMSWRLKDVDALCPNCGPPTPGAGPGGPPAVLPPGTLPAPGAAPDKEAPPIPPARNGEPQPMPVTKPPVPELPAPPKVPDVPKTSRMPAPGRVLTIGASEPARGIVPPAEAR